MKNKNTHSLTEELQSFQTLWKNGFHTLWDEKRNQTGLENFIKEDMKKKKVCLEIGCGGGQWSKFIYNLNIFDKILCIDALSAEHNNFWEHVGEHAKDKITYVKVKDFSLDFIENNSIDYVFSYDVWCHISYSGQEEYLKNLKNKCVEDARLCIMYADALKYSKSEPDNFEYQRQLWKQRKKEFNNDEELAQILIDDCDSDPEPGRWYWIGIDKFIELCEKYNYNIIHRDLNIDKTNPITLFTI